MKDCSILLRIDNTTAISYINRMGGIQYPSLNSIDRELWQWCEARNIFVFASYIRSSANIEPDRESRRLKPETKWELADYAFQTIVKKISFPEIDLLIETTQNVKLLFLGVVTPKPSRSTLPLYLGNTYVFMLFRFFASYLKSCKKLWPIVQRVYSWFLCGIHNPGSLCFLHC